MLKNHSIQHSIQFFQNLFIQINYSFIIFKNYSFKESIHLFFLKIIHSNKLFLKNYSFKEKFIQKNWQLFIQKIIHLEKNGNYSFKKLFN